MEHRAFTERTYEYTRLEHSLVEAFIDKYGAGSDYVPFIRRLLTIVEDSGALKLGQLTPIDINAERSKRTRRS